MKRIANKTQRPLSVPLPGGKTLYLGPGREGAAPSKADEYPPIRKLVEAGALEVLGDGALPTGLGTRGAQRRGAAEQRGAGRGRHRSGDR